MRRIEAESGDVPSMIIRYDDRAVNDGGGYGGDMDPRPDIVKQEDRRLRRRKDRTV
jgi:hypothetical protein